MTQSAIPAARLLGYRNFTDGNRPIYEDARGQFVFDPMDGSRIYGIFMIPEDAPDLPLIVEAGKA